MRRPGDAKADPVAPGGREPAPLALAEHREFRDTSLHVQGTQGSAKNISLELFEDSARFR